MKIKEILTEQGVLEGSLEEIDRRGFLKGMGAAAVAGAGMIPKASPGQDIQSWNEKVTNAVKSRIVYADKDPSVNPKVEVEIELLPNGEVVNTKIIQPSGVDSWDEAVIAAIKRLRVFPKRDDGTVPRRLIIGWSPKHRGWQIWRDYLSGKSEQPQ
jgi:TonB family protein